MREVKPIQRRGKKLKKNVEPEAGGEGEQGNPSRGKQGGPNGKMFKNL